MKTFNRRLLLTTAVSSGLVSLPLLKALAQSARRRADLVIDAIRWSEDGVVFNTEPVLEGSDVTFEAVIRNSGRVATPPGTAIEVEFRVGSAVVSTSNSFTTGLARDATVTLRANTGPDGDEFWNDVSPGSQTVTARADPRNLIVESSDSNNTRTATIVVEAQGEPPVAGLFVAPGVPIGQGSGTFENPWGGLEFAIGQLSAGDILNVRGGSYYENDVDITVVGTSSNPIIIKAYEGETPILDGRLPEFLQSGGWTLHSGNVYKSNNTYPTGNIAHGFFEDGGKLYKLVSYKSLAALSTSNQNWASDGIVYCGPGVFYNSSDDRVYIRLEKPNPANIAGQTFSVPSTTNPNNLKIHVGVHGSGVVFTNAAHVTWDGIHIFCHEQNARFFTSNNCVMKNHRILVGQYGIITSSGSGYKFDNIDFECWLPQWVSWTDIKTSPAPAERNKVLGWENNATASNIEVSNCNFFDAHDGFNSNGTGGNIRVHHCTFTNVQDDAGEFGVEAGFCEMAFCFAEGELIGHDSNGTTNTSGLGQKYIHHNICNARSHVVFWARSDPNNLLSSSLGDFPLHTHNAIGSHGQSSSPHFDPYKIYHNTFIYGNQQNSEDHHLAGWGAAPRSGDPKHEVYNNLFVVDNTPALYDPHETLGGDFEEYDGNCYFKLAGSANLIRFYESSDSYQTLAAFRQDNPTSNFEVHGVEGNPGIDLANEDYRPSATGPAGSGAIDLRATGWPGAGNQGFRGAIAPSASGPRGGVGAP